MKTKILLLIISTLLLSLTVRFVIPSEVEITIDQKSRQRGVCWVGGRQVVTEKDFESLKKNNVNWISQTPFAWQRSFSDPEIRMNTNSERVWWGESDLGIAETTQIARKLNIRTLLKPHLWIRDSWPGEVKMENEEKWNEWFANYKTFIIHYARLAETNRIEIFCIGTELSNASAHDTDWRKLIREIRKVYSGQLTYAANFHGEFEKIKFWDALDFIGVQAYFSLSQKNNPTTQELMANWTHHLNSVENIHKKYDKPILFTEIGYRSTDDAAIEPWKWPQENKEAVSSAETQAKCYEAFFNTAWKKPWLAGAYFWKWYPHRSNRLLEIDFTPQGKLAEKILMDNFSNHYDQ
ncbi:MAG TPA: hypothetical protein VIS49_12545 [Cyclobacteriaceae bacterium]